MKKTLLALALAAPFAAAAQAESYTLDPHHTFPNFSLDYLGYATIWGRFNKSSGKFVIDRAGKKGSLELTVETASVDTADNDKGNRPRSRDEHLRSPDFFNVAEFPRMSYKATNVKFSGDNPSEVSQLRCRRDQASRPQSGTLDVQGSSLLQEAVLRRQRERRA
jgi:polyisoprenoid-binding protein YceI